MIQQFRSQYSEDLKLYRLKIASSPFVLSLSEPFYGFLDQATYDKWKLSSDINYFEASNLIFQMTRPDVESDNIRQMGQDLISEGYDSIENPDFDKEKVDEQIALIRMVFTNHFGEMLDDILEQERKAGDAGHS